QVVGAEDDLDLPLTVSDDVGGDVASPDGVAGWRDPDGSVIGLGGEAGSNLDVDAGRADALHVRTVLSREDAVGGPKRIPGLERQDARGDPGADDEDPHQLRHCCVAGSSFWSDAGAFTATESEP